MTKLSALINTPGSTLRFACSSRLRLNTARVNNEGEEPDTPSPRHTCYTQSELYASHPRYRCSEGGKAERQSEVERESSAFTSNHAREAEACKTRRAHNPEAAAAAAPASCFSSSRSSRAKCDDDGDAESKEQAKQQRSGCRIPAH